MKKMDWQKFVPARYAVYGGMPGGQLARIAGYDNMTDATICVEDHSKRYPGCEYQIWEARVWEKVKDLAPT